MLPLNSSFTSVFHSVAPVVRLYFTQAFGLPRTWIASDCYRHFNVLTPQCKALLADSAWRKDEKRPTRFASGDAYRRDYAETKAIGFAESPGLMA